jgi:hypothetical protein
MVAINTPCFNVQYARKPFRNSCNAYVGKYVFENVTIEIDEQIGRYLPHTLDKCEALEFLQRTNI